MKINENTRIAALIASNKNTIEALISVSPRFAKLRNPVLRKVMAGQVSISMAARVGGVSLEAVLRALEKIGFEVERLKSSQAGTNSDAADPVSSSSESLQASHASKRGAVDAQQIEQRKQEFLFRFRDAGIEVLHLDVRPMLEKGQEPLSSILDLAEQVEPGQGLEIINSFPPEPLLPLLGSKGFEGFLFENGQEYRACFIRMPAEPDSQKGVPLADEGPDTADSGQPVRKTIDPDSPPQKRKLIWKTVTGLRTASGVDRAVVRLDVRGMSPPQPMTRILHTLESMGPGQWLYVFHERIPQFLLPHLKEQNYHYTISERSESDVRLLIGRKG